MMSCVILSAPVFSVSFFLPWSIRQLPLSPVSCDADVVNVATDTHTVTQQVKGGSCIPNTVCVSKSYGECSTLFYHTTEEMMSLICAVSNCISTLYCNILT